LRAKLAQGKSKAWIVTFGEGLSTAVALLAALFAQSQVTGIRFAAPQPSYDFYHGQWHFLISVTTSIVYTRVSQAAQKIKSHTLCYQNTFWCFDGIGLLLIACYSLTVIGLKENSVDLSVSKQLLGAFCVGLCVHAIVTLVYFAKLLGFQKWLLDQTRDQNALCCQCSV
jgi:hypothetical protein